MKRIFIVSLVLLSAMAFSQGWLSKNAVRIEDADASFKVVFTDSSYADIQKSNVIFISDYTNSKWVQIAWRYDGTGQRMITVDYSQLTTPDADNAKELSELLNEML